MKRNVLVFGSISAVLISLWLIIGVGLCHNEQNYDGNMIMGFTAMFLSFSLVFVGVKNYRDKYNGGTITFLKALQLSFYISMVTCVTYVVVWMIEYYVFMPDFMEKLTGYMVAKAQKTGNAKEIADTVKEVAKWRDWYSTPWGVAMATFMEIFPVAVVASLITSLILMWKKPKSEAVAVA